MDAFTSYVRSGDFTSGGIFYLGIATSGGESLAIRRQSECCCSPKLKLCTPHSQYQCCFQFLHLYPQEVRFVWRSVVQICSPLTLLIVRRIRYEIGQLLVMMEYKMQRWCTWQSRLKTRNSSTILLFESTRGTFRLTIRCATLFASNASQCSLFQKWNRTIICYDGVRNAEVVHMTAKLKTRNSSTILLFGSTRGTFRLTIRCATLFASNASQWSSFQIFDWTFLREDRVRHA
jgi:hypothetical protein